MPPPLARQAAEGCPAGSRCDRRAPQGIVCHSSSLSLPTTWPVESDSGLKFASKQACRLDYAGLRSISIVGPYRYLLQVEASPDRRLLALQTPCTVGIMPAAQSELQAS